MRASITSSRPGKRASSSSARTIPTHVASTFSPFDIPGSLVESTNFFINRPVMSRNSFFRSTHSGLNHRRDSTSFFRVAAAHRHRTGSSTCERTLFQRRIFPLTTLGLFSKSDSAFNTQIYARPCDARDALVDDVSPDGYASMQWRHLRLRRNRSQVLTRFYVEIVSELRATSTFFAMQLTN